MVADIVAGIVLYKPDYERLEKNIRNLLQQFVCIILFNNGADIDKIKYLERDNIYIIGENVNLGIAAALNRIMQKAADMNIEWVVTLDQDSIVPENMVVEFSRYLSDNSIAIICPQLIDKRRKYMTIKKNPENEYLTMCSTSGSCTSVKHWKELGGFDEWLFIDLVDNDYCKRVVLNKLKIFRINTVVMDHQFGEIERRSAVVENFWGWLGKILHRENIAKLSFRRIVNPTRIYYENRNVIYLDKKYENYGGIGFENHHVKTYFGFMIVFSVYSLLVGKNKVKIFKAIQEGIRDGKRKAKITERLVYEMR